MRKEYDNLSQIGMFQISSTNVLWITKKNNQFSSDLALSVFFFFDIYYFILLILLNTYKSFYFWPLTQQFDTRNFSQNVILISDIFIFSCVNR